ncbi:M23 family metallopeptidase [Deinococcus taklimakanensis]|uniref:M23 family metallopeptidase n=1 Tax=Deinococcus taklimakanensis TaxID=536443 RepID=A0ABW5P830_9DEIO
MRRIAALSAIISLSAILAACNNGAVESPSPSTAAPAPVSPGAVQRVFSESERYKLFAGTKIDRNVTFEDGRLWLLDKTTNQIQLLLAQPVQGQIPYVQGAILSPAADIAYAVVSNSTDRKQNNFLVSITLPSGKMDMLGNIEELGLSDINALSLAMSSNGTIMGFQGAEIGETDVSGLEHDNPHYHPSGIEYGNSYGVYELNFGTTKVSPLSLGKLKERLHLVQKDNGKGLLPNFKDGVRVTAVAGKGNEFPGLLAQDLGAQVVNYNIRFPLYNLAYYVTTGYNTAPTHIGNDQYALDLSRAANTDCGNAVVAAADGTVATSTAMTDPNKKPGDPGYYIEYGEYITIAHNQLGAKTLYAHLQKRDVLSGATVTRGQVIGYVGTTGNSSACHLHFAYRNLSTNAALVPATSTKPMQGFGPSTSETGGTCPINGFSGASSTIWYRYGSC